MILQNSGLSAWVTDSRGEPLPEYEVNQLDGNTIECWIPSVEGENFEIHYRCIEGAKLGYDLQCRPSLDGVHMVGQFVSKRDVANGYSCRLYCYPTSSSTARLYQFGRRELTDEGNVSQAERSMQKHLNTIQAKFSWGRTGRKYKNIDYTTPKDIGPIHEKAAKKGHSGSAGLGKTVTRSAPRRSTFHEEESLESIAFIFRYAPEDWLKAREIIPCSPNPEDESHVGKKRPRETTPEIVDVDELETDDDEIVIIKHMIPAPMHPKQKRRKSQTNIKPEEDTDEDDTVTPGEQDIKSETSN